MNKKLQNNYKKCKLSPKKFKSLNKNIGHGPTKCNILVLKMQIVDQKNAIRWYKMCKSSTKKKKCK